MNAINVQPATFTTALKAAQPGDELVLAAGAYPKLVMGGKSDLIIRSEDPANPASFTSIAAAAGKNLIFRGLNLKGDDGLALKTTLRLTSCQNILVDDCDIEAAAVGVSAGSPFYAINSQDVVLIDSHIRGGHETVFFVDCDRVSAIRNTLSDFGAVAVRSGGNNYLMIDGNHMARAISKSWPIKDHGDFIHCWTDHVRGVSRNITIINNTMDQDSGNPIMGISLQNTQGAYFDGVRVENNLYLGDNAQALRFDGVRNAKVLRNAFVPTCTKGTRLVGTKTIFVGEAKLLINGAQGVKVDGNIFGGLPRAGGVTQGKNLAIKFADLPKVFVDPTNRSHQGFTALAGGPGAGLGIH